VEWSSSKTTINASQLLVKLYKEEDERFGVKVDNGILQNTERPLNPDDSYYTRKQGLDGTEIPAGMGSQMDGVSNPEGAGAGNSTSSHLKMIDGGVDASAKMNQSQTHSLRNSHSNIKASRSLQQALTAGDKQ